MGKWVVVAQRGSNGDTYRCEVVRRVTGSREDAREAMRAASLTFHEPWREKSREVYRYPSGDGCLVIVRGLMSETLITLSIAELVHDSADPDPDPDRDPDPGPGPGPDADPDPAPDAAHVPEPPTPEPQDSVPPV
ncbi:hypothetical protein ACFU51_09935 [Streptomyces sp. NPDC057430]|uniref:hypothetical protein n=1 Tax=Streptomyces sp. NPDC057430 TaxID=3346131 RepID=UPI0036A21719